LQAIPATGGHSHDYVCHFGPAVMDFRKIIDDFVLKPTGDEICKLHSTMD